MPLIPENRLRLSGLALAQKRGNFRPANLSREPDAIKRPWAPRSKRGFKVLQYITIEIPTLVSPVGINTEAVADGQNNFVCQEPVDWEAVLRRLLAEPRPSH